MKVDDTPCPSCGHKTLVITEQLTARPIGRFSLAGAQMKFSAEVTPVLSCDQAHCGFRVTGEFDDDRHVVFPKPEGAK